MYHLEHKQEWEVCVQSYYEELRGDAYSDFPWKAVWRVKAATKAAISCGLVSNCPIDMEIFVHIFWGEVVDAKGSE